MDKTELKRRRETLGFTQTSLAEAVGISANTISRYETGTMDIPKYMELALEALEVRQIKNCKAKAKDEIRFKV